MAARFIPLPLRRYVPAIACILTYLALVLGVGMRSWAAAAWAAVAGVAAGLYIAWQPRGRR